MFVVSRVDHAIVCFIAGSGARMEGPCDEFHLRFVPWFCIDLKVEHAGHRQGFVQETCLHKKGFGFYPNHGAERYVSVFSQALLHSSNLLLSEVLRSKHLLIGNYEPSARTQSGLCGRH